MIIKSEVEFSYHYIMKYEWLILKIIVIYILCIMIY